VETWAMARMADLEAYNCMENIASEFEAFIAFNTNS